MPEGNAWKYRPERQARLLANMANPEYMRRKDIYRKAQGQLAKLRVSRWNRAWNEAGRPASFIDYPEWAKATPLDAYEQIIADADKAKRAAKRTN